MTLSQTVFFFLCSMKRQQHTFCCIALRWTLMCQSILYRWNYMGKSVFRNVHHRHISKYCMYTLQFRQMCREETAIRLLQDCGCKVDILCWMIKEQQALGFLQCICSPPLSFLPLFVASSQQSATREQTEMEMREGAAKDTLITHTGILNLSSFRLSPYLSLSQWTQTIRDAIT